MKKIQSTCNLCALACNIDFYVEGEKIIKVSPTKHYPVNKGFCCIKGLNLDKQQTKVKKNIFPLLKDENGNMKEISWEEGFEVFAKKMTEIQEKYGKESVAYISTGQMTTEDMAILGHVGRNYMKINGDGNTRLCMATSVVAHKQTFGFDAPPYTLKDAELSDTLIFIGANPVIAHPVFWGRIMEHNKDANIIVIDPRKSETAMMANEWIDINPKLSIHPFSINTFASVYKSTKSPLGFISIHSCAFIAVSDFLGSITIIFASLFPLTRPQNTGCAITGFAPINIIVSESSASFSVYGGASNPKLCLCATTDVAIHSLVFPSPGIFIKFLPTCPSSAISSVVICPVLINATLS